MIGTITLTYTQDYLPKTSGVKSKDTQRLDFSQVLKPTRLFMTLVAPEHTSSFKLINSCVINVWHQPSSLKGGFVQIFVDLPHVAPLLFWGFYVLAVYPSLTSLKFIILKLQQRSNFKKSSHHLRMCALDFYEWGVKSASFVMEDILIHNVGLIVSSLMV